MEEQMKALVCHQNGSISLEDRPVPILLEETDAVVKVTLSTICMSDLHIMRGAVPRAVPETVLGHEFVGEVVSVGEQVRTLRPGDRVAANCITFCGECYFCKKGFINNCQNGGWELGCRIDGCQAEYVRVPFAEQGLTKIPDQVTDENALFVGDILSSGYFGAELCDITPGDTIAVIGAGPVGLCGMLCARLFGAAKIIAMDIDPYRLSFAKEQGLADVTISPTEADWEKTIAQETHGWGADGVIEAAGGKDTFDIAWKIARPNSVVALIAMYEENQTFPLPSMYGKNLIFKTGGVDAVHCERLMELIAAGKINTDFLITHKAPLNDILKGYEVFGERKDHCYKWAVTPYEERA